MRENDGWREEHRTPWGGYVASLPSFGRKASQSGKSRGRRLDSPIIFGYQWLTTHNVDCALQVTVLRKEKIVLVFASPAMRERVLSDLNECIEFASAGEHTDIPVSFRIGTHFCETSPRCFQASTPSHAEAKWGPPTTS